MAGHAHRLEGAGAHVQGQLDQIHAFGAQGGEHRLVEMQTRGRRGHCTGHARVDRLVALLVGCVGRVADVGRQRQRAVAIEQREHAFRGIKSQQEEIAAPLGYGRLDALGQHEPRTRPRAVARAHVREGFVGAEHALDQNFDPAAGGLLAEQAGLDDAGVVEHEDVARGEETGQLGEQMVRHRVAGQVQQAARAARLCRALRDQFARKVVVEVVKRQGHAHGAV